MCLPPTGDALRSLGTSPGHAIDSGSCSSRMARNLGPGLLRVRVLRYALQMLRLLVGYWSPARAGTLTMGLDWPDVCWLTAPAYAPGRRKRGPMYSRPLEDCSPRAIANTPSLPPPHPV
jgi:hypothetical protein